ncbi:Veg family protein [Limosilactobacillus panis]|uniref:Veg family protein n=1 Tax=Limosilactobacillus panis TaxID=47493 RepID=A0ABT7VMR6_9LACO|nr:Veg family protein [Limosilactobacillus panis]MDM8334035.1 Veg family protein [Limosilactobacillus panis]HJA22548.1 Veg family protein [Candidatus Limosilactobacillus intestinipullorum]
MPESIVEIKKELDDRIGQPVLVKAQAGRKRVATHHGVLSKTYPAIFVVHLNDGQGSLDRISYSYTDLLTHNISLAFEPAD